MRRIFSQGITIVCIMTCFFAKAQVTTDPEFPTSEESVVVTFDATQGTGGLAGFSGDVYAHTGVLTSESSNNSDWKYVKTDWGENTEETKLTRIGDDLYELTISPTIREYYGVPDGEDITHLAFVFRSADTSLEGKGDGGSDIFVEILTDGFAASLNQPTQSSILVDQNDIIDIEAGASEAATFTLVIGGATVDTQAAITSYQYMHTVTETTGSVDVSLTITNGTESVEVGFTYTLREATISESRPAGIIKGINYDAADDTKATLCLQAPGKSSAYVIGDFNDWRIDADYQMKQDGEFFWLEVSGLTSGTEYAFQYVVDESIFIADPYTDKILHPDDRFISEETYPNLKEYPSSASNSQGIYNTVSVLQTGQSEYDWTIDNFERPAQTDLVIYELLVRDFFGDGEENYQNLIDTLSYVKSLGVNAIELMPITEFSGNDSWGYNPTFMFASDKAYGSKNDLKAFIDAAHGLGIAVILDMVLNQQEQPSPLILLDFNLSNSQVTADNPYFNVSATHPFNVFYDMNHESEYTQAFVDTVNHYWINEFKFDGYRFDLSKGFTQTNYGSNVGAWSSYDAGRVALLKRMADKIWSHSPDAYVILEHFADNTEETELANYGMMLWGNLHGAYKQNILGFESNSDFSWIYHDNRGWNDRHVVGYFESHDEERQMYEAQLYGNSIGEYTVRDLPNALQRVAAASAMFYTIPGPKMLWQFGELGYDISIDENGRTGQKPTPWDDSEGLNYYNDFDRDILRQYVAELIKLKVNYPVFNEANVTLTTGNNLIKQMALENLSGESNPTSEDQMSAVVVANFNIESESVPVSFPFNGTWYNYFEGTSLEIANQSAVQALEPGEFHVFTNMPLDKPQIITGLEEGANSNAKMTIYPNPTTDFITIDSKDEPLYYFLYDLTGKKIKQGKFTDLDYTIDVGQLTGIGFVEVITRGGDRMVEKVMKR